MFAFQKEINIRTSPFQLTRKVVHLVAFFTEPAVLEPLEFLGVIFKNISHHMFI